MAMFDFLKSKKKPSDKKEDENEFNAASAKTSKAKYKVVIKEKFAKGTTTFKTIECQRYIDPDDYVVYLQNMKGNIMFMELMPQDENDYVKLNEKEVDNKLKIVRLKLKNEEKYDDEDINIKNLKFEIMRLEAKKRGFKYDPDSPYMTIDEDGTKVFYFLREGSTFHPFKWDTDTKTIYVANDNKKKKAGMARKNKSYKYSKFKNVIEGSVMFMMVLNVILAAGLGYIGLKFFSKLDESKIIEAQNFCIQKGAEWTQIVQKNAEAAESILNTLKERAQIGGITGGIVDKFVPKESNQ